VYHSPFSLQAAVAHYSHGAREPNCFFPGFGFIHVMFFSGMRDTKVLWSERLLLRLQKKMSVRAMYSNVRIIEDSS
jgi:hypothetical protein